MNKKELYYLVKLNNKEKLVIIKAGNFYYAYEDDALILSSLFNYKYKNNKVRFPNNKNDMKGYNTNNINSYNKVLKEAKIKTRC